MTLDNYSVLGRAEWLEVRSWFGVLNKFLSLPILVHVGRGAGSGSGTGVDYSSSSSSCSSTSSRSCQDLCTRLLKAFTLPCVGAMKLDEGVSPN